MLSLITLSLGQMQANCYIVYDPVSLDAVIIDPGDEPEKITDVIKENKLAVKHIILTHGHFDHIGAVNDIANNFGADIIVNENDKDFLTMPILNLSAGFLNSDISVSCNNVKTVKDCSLNLIGCDFEFISTPGHSPGSMCIKVSDMLFTGDTLFYMSVGNEFPPYGNFEQEIRSIKNKLFTIDGDYTCYPGHGPRTSLEFERSNNPYTGV